MAYDRIITIIIRAPFRRDEYDAAIPGEIVYQRRHWCTRIDGGAALETASGQTDAAQEITYRLRYAPELLTHDPALIQIHDPMRFMDGNGRMDEFRVITPYRIHETELARRREIEIMATLKQTD